jgi:5-methylcytosine-specific restriction enzyme B
LNALRYPHYTQLYNRIKNPHTVIPLSKSDYEMLLSLMQVDDAGAPASESRLPNALSQLTAYVVLAHSMGSSPFESHALVEAAQSLDPPAAEQLDADDLVTELLQLRLIEVTDATHYQPRPYVAGDRTALIKLCALAVLASAEGTTDEYTLPARTILPRLYAATAAQPTDRFAPELGADGLVLLGWYVEAGLVDVDQDLWQARADAFTLPTAGDPASRAYLSFLQTLIADSAGTLETDLAHVALDAPLPTITDFETRLQQLGQDLLFDTAIVRRIYRSLLAGRHVVLSGPPGTGKTELARLLPSLLWGEEPHIYRRLTYSPGQPPVDEVTVQRLGYASMIVTATEDWGVRDVVGGIGPRLNAQSGLSYTIEHGVLARVVLQHYEGTDSGRRMPPANAHMLRRDYQPAEQQRYRGIWLVIDEFTRAPIDAAFGSLLTTLSGNEHAKLAVPTAAGEMREVPLPRDFRIIGTLNSFDRHFLNQISEAMKRRFDFIDVLPPPPEYGIYEQGIAVKQALSRLHRQGFTQISGVGDPATYTWFGVLLVEPTTDASGQQRYQWRAELPAAEAALESFWRLFSAVRVFRQLGTAQVIAVYMNIFTGVFVGMPWNEALDTALADGLADQLQVLNRDEQQLIEAFVRLAGAPITFANEVRVILGRVPAGRRLALRAALRDADQQRNSQQQSDIVPDQATLTDEQIARVFSVGTPLALPGTSVFMRRIRDLAGERGL